MTRATLGSLPSWRRRRRERQRAFAIRETLAALSLALFGAFTYCAAVLACAIIGA